MVVLYFCQNPTTQPKINNLFWPDENSIEQCFAAYNTKQVVEPKLACNQVLQC